MPEPFSLSAFIVTSAVAGFIGNRTDARVMTTWRSVVARMREGGAPANHDIQRAVRKSQLQATLLAVEARLKELGVEPSHLRRFLHAVFRPGGEVEWLDDARDHLNRQLQELKKPEYVPPPLSGGDEFARFLAPAEGDPAAEARELRDALAGEMLQELRVALPRVPRRFEEMVREGWDEGEPGAGRDRWRWFELVCAFFAHELKHNQPLANIIQSQLLLEVRAAVASLSESPGSGLQDFGRGVAEHFARVEEALAGMRAGQAEGFEGVERRLDALLPMLLLLPSIQSQQEMLSAVQRDEHELTRRDFRKGLDETNAKIEELFAEASKGAAARNEEVLREIASLGERRPPPAAEAGERRPIPLLLPELRGTFVNREGEQETLRHLLREGGMRLVVIVAPGGYGKTALMTKFLQDITSGQSILDERVGGILYLHCVREGFSLRRIFTEAGRIVGRPEEFEQVYDSQDLSEGRKLEFFFRELSGGGDVWVVLDNFEVLLAADDTLAEPEVGRFIEAAVSTRHSVRLIATTRAVPRLAAGYAARPVDLRRGLPEDHAVEYLRAYGADCGLADEDEALLRSLARRVHYIPKALEAVIGFLRDKYPLVTLRELMQDDALFADFDRYDAEQGVRRLIAEQFDGLGPLEQLTLSCLSVFPKGVPAEALRYILRNVDVGAVLPRLIRNRLVEAQGAGRGALYDLHPLVREYVYGRLPEEGGADALFTRQSLHRLAAGFYGEWKTPAEGWRTLADLEPRLDEFDHLVKAGEYTRAARLLGEIDADYLLPWGESRRLLLMGEQLAGRLEDPALAAANLLRLGLACRNLGLYREAVEHLDDALREARAAGDGRVESLALGSLGICHYYVGEYEMAAEYSGEAVKAAAERGFQEQESEQLRFLGHAHEGMGNYAEAIEHYRAALSAAERIGGLRGRRMEENARGGLGKAFMPLGRHAEAAEELRVASAVAREVNDRRGESFNLANLALARRSLGLYEQAEETYAAALALALDIGERNVEAYCLGGLGKIRLLRKQYDAALEGLSRALKITRETGMKGGQQHWATTVAQARLHRGELEAAAEALRPVLDFDVVWNNHRTAAVSGLILARRGQSEAAEAAFTKALAHAAESLERAADNYAAKYTRGLSLAGLALLTPDPERKAEYARLAREAYQAARANCSDGGIVAEATHLFEELSPLGQSELLASVRPHLAGES